MTSVAPEYTDEEIIGSFEAKADYWEEQARIGPPESAWACIDYAKHLRTIAECLRMDVLEKAAFNEGDQ